MKIGELSARTDVSVRLLRYYEEQGLLTPGRTAGGQRVYDAEAPRTVRRIRAFLDAGLPTRAIREILDCVCGSEAEVEPCLTPMLLDQLREIEERIENLEGSRASLTGILAATRG
ncbi:MerR family transcriptional regulator [Streptomyces sp. VRA16 Mangrove soil]|uniref:MerR family transcriptional regulator n=1 Tax=Streptomyces sp. VRA16 Mangrove soil TaxID=2817434 RepID=UPI001A9E37A6|nr:MerR family transcriptional regulator [Streptomyces sp. VRA16 Mangrove soil]MBO1333488.1 MerR family transcriptional regulator [Streptomyces sp. VRA16 Mangrove soil]